MDIKVEIQPKEIIANVLTPVEPIYGGTKNYENLENLPSINGIEIIGNLTLEKLGIQPQGDYAKRSELPQNVSDLNNDAGYLVQSDLTDYAKLENLPTKVSQLENDSNYATKSDLPTKTSELENDSDLAYVTDIPTNVSELNNDSNYLVRSDISNLDNHVIDTDNPHKVLKSQVGLGNVDNTSDADKPLSIAQKKYIDDSYANSNAYTDQKIADLIGGAPETLDTLKEVSDAIKESKDVETALNNAIGTKANQTELDTHTGNDTIHITADERTNWNDANSKKHTHSNKSILDKITQTLLDDWDAAYTHISDTVKHITSDERTSWNNKYAKPSGGIPKTDLASAVQTSLGKADTALQAHQDISGLATKTELTAHTNNIDNPHSVTKSQVGLGNVNNTSDKDKPISTAQQTEFDKLNSNLSQLSYSDDSGSGNLFNGVICGKLNANFQNGVLTNTSTDSKTAFAFQIQVYNGSTLVFTSSQITATGGARNSISLTIPNTSNVTFLRLKHNGSQRDIYIDIPFTKTGNFMISIYVSKNNPSAVGGLEIRDIQIEEGTTATEYKPFIQSVKMLSEKSTQIDDNNMLGWVVPEEMPIKNYVDSNCVFHQRVGRVELSELYWTKSSNDDSLFYSSLDDFKKSLDYTNTVYCKKYNTSSSQNTAVNKNITGFVDADNVYPTKNWIYIKDETYTSDSSGLKESLKGVYAYYELATEITTNIDGNEAVTKVNESLSDYGLNNVCGKISNGYWDNSSKQIVSSTDYYCSSEIKAKASDKINIHANGATRVLVRYYDSSNAYIGQTDITSGDFSNITVNPLSNTASLGVSVKGITKFSVYTNNAIDEIKNDLAKLFSSNITGIKLNGSTLEVSFNNGTSVGKVSFEGIAEEETIIS